MSEGIKCNVVGFADEGPGICLVPQQGGFGIAVGDEVTIYPGHTPRYTEAEWQEKQREKRPDAEVIERAREWLSQGLRAEDPEVHCGEQLTEARIVLDDLLCYAMFGPQEALREHQERWDDPHSTSLASPTTDYRKVLDAGVIVCPPSRVKIERKREECGAR